MIDNFSGIDTEGGGGHYGFSDSSFFLKDRSNLKYFITQEMGQSSMFLTLCTICYLGG